MQDLYTVTALYKRGLTVDSWCT